MGKIQLGVMYGSRSCEHEVSIISALQLMQSVNQDRYDVIPVYISMQGVWYTGEQLKSMNTYTPFREDQKGLVRVSLDMTPGSGALLAFEQGKGLLGGTKQRVVARLECVIPVFHGMHGEDGTLQGLLELANLPYASPGVAGSAVGMDKIIMKRHFRGAGFPVLDDIWFSRQEFRDSRENVLDKIENKIGYPVYAKPANLGSSIGVSRAENREELAEALELAFVYDRRVLLEKGLTNPIELNCSVVGFDTEIKASVLEMPVTSGALLSFANKYLQGGGGAKGMASLARVVPAPIEDSLRDQIQSLSKDIFRELDLKGVVRIDYMYDVASEKLYVTEVNTIPGSMAYYLWEKSGMNYPELIDEMVHCAMKAHQEKNDNNYAFTSDILKNVKLGGKTGVKGSGKLANWTGGK
jgi:D-alanine-D-alanine ligase